MDDLITYAPSEPEKEALYIHTHDRIAFKRCRRKWSFSSPLRHHVVPKDSPPSIYLWFGTGIHFALEDYHGYRRFSEPQEALLAYYAAFKQNDLPMEAEEHIALGVDMLQYYLKWLENRDVYKTVWIDGVPQVEVRFELELTEISNKVGKPVIYRGTLDRLVIDEHGGLWIQDYKTAKTIDTKKLSRDPQIGAYVWAAEQYFQKEVQGMLYTQFAKKTPQKPSLLKNGTFSVNKQQHTCYRIYRDALLEEYPDGKFPGKYIEFLNDLAAQETFEGDEFIRTDPVYRNRTSKINTYNHIIEEVTEMVNPNTPLYPNPTRDCSWDCTEFGSMCLAMDEGDDWEYMLKEFYVAKPDERDTWRSRIKYPDTKT